MTKKKIFIKKKCAFASGAFRFDALFLTLMETPLERIDLGPFYKDTLRVVYVHLELNQTSTHTCT